MSYLGSWNLDKNLTFVCNTHNPANGMAQNADAVPTYHVYEDETATPIITGSMALLNNPETLGFYSEQISLSAANGFERDKSYHIYIRAVVSNVTGTMSHTFQIGSYVLDVINPVTAGNVTGSVFGNVNGSVGSVTSPVGISTGTFLDAGANAVWRTLLPGTFVAGQAGYLLASRMPTGTVVVGTNNDKTGYSLASPQNFDLVGNISGTLTNVLNVVNPVTAGNVTGSVLGNVNGSVNSVVTPVGISTGSLINAIADQVWDEQLSGHLLAGSTGFTLNSAGSAGDPWGTALPGAYGAGTAGNILGNRLDTAVGSRMPSGTVVVATNQDKNGYSLATGTNIPVNVKQINDTNLIGNGSSTPWGPA